MENRKQNQGCSCSFSGIGLLLLIISLFSGSLTLRAIGLGLLTLGCLKSMSDLVFSKKIAKKIAPLWKPLEYGNNFINASIFSTIANTFLWGGWCAHCVAKIYEYPQQVTDIILWGFIIAIPLVFHTIGYIKKKSVEEKIAINIVEEEFPQTKSRFDNSKVEDVEYEEVK